MALWIKIVGVSLVTLTAGVGFLHTRAGQALIGKSCPFGMDKNQTFSPEARDKLRETATRALVQGPSVDLTPAGPFMVGKSQKSDVLHWASLSKSDCKPGKDLSGLVCNVALGQSVGRFGPVLSTAGTTYFEFASDGKLMSLLSMSYSAEPLVALSAVQEERHLVEMLVGKATKVAGSDSQSFLQEKPLRQTRVEFRRSNYYATLSATNMGGGKYLVSKLYRAL